jgi:quinol-cytochrome oxidoreductase complex cytochrome b subunit
LFCCCAFFFQNVKEYEIITTIGDQTITEKISLFKRDFQSYMAVFWILLFLGIGFVCFYIMTLVTHIDTNTRQADRYDLAYKIVFSLTLVILVTRSFLGDFKGDGTMLNIPYQTFGIIIAAIISGIITWVTPKIKDNDNTEF